MLASFKWRGEFGQYVAILTWRFVSNTTLTVLCFIIYLCKRMWSVDIFEEFYFLYLIIISSIVFGLKKSYFSLIHLPSCYRTKWTSLEVRTHPTFLETLISKYDFGPVIFPGLSRNGPQVHGMHVQLPNKLPYPSRAPLSCSGKAPSLTLVTGCG